MAGSRIEKIGTVFSRVQGLIKSKAIAPTEKPVWFDVYKAFPPKVEPTYNRMLINKEPVDILYREDNDRAYFYSTFTADAVHMRSDSLKNNCQRFVEKCTILRNENPKQNETSIYEEAKKILENEGVLFRSLEEIAKEKMEMRKKLSALNATNEGESKDTAAPLSRDSDPVTESREDDDYDYVEKPKPKN